MGTITFWFNIGADIAFLSLFSPIFQISYARYWNQKWKGLDVGHRGNFNANNVCELLIKFHYILGAGTSFKVTSGGELIRENTIASLKKAALSGADMVEFDVQLSKDLVPVIYHDFHVYVSLKKKATFDANDMLELPMRELTLEQLKNLKVSKITENAEIALLTMIFHYFKRFIMLLKVVHENQSSLMKISLIINHFQN